MRLTFFCTLVSLFNPSKCEIDSQNKLTTQINPVRKLIFILLALIPTLGSAQLNINHFIEVGETRIQIGNYVGAIENFNIVIRFKPYLPEPYYYRGVAKHQLEDYRGAIQDYDKAIEIKPYYPDAFMNRGLAYLQLNDFAKSIADYDRAIELDPNNSTIYNNRGIAKISMKDVDGAIADYNKAIELNPKFTNSYINRSNALLMKNDVRGAIKDLNQAIIIRPHFANAYLLRGLARFELNDYASALRDFDECIKLDPKNAYAFNNRGIVKQKLEDFKGAIMDYNLALQLDATMANAYMNRGIAKEMLKLPGSDEDYAIAAKLDPKFAFNPKDVDYNSLAQAKQKANQAQQNQSAAAGQTPDKDKNKNGKKAVNSNSATAASQTDQASKQETKEERDRRRFKLSLADSRTVTSPKDQVIDNGLIQNKNIVIDLQPLFVLSSFDKNASDYERTQYYNLELENINNFNNYNPTITISNKPVDGLKDVFKNQILFFNEKVKNNNKESMNFLNRGIFYFLTDEYTQAMSDINKAVELNSGNMLAYFSRANCNLKMIDLIEQVKETSDPLTISIKNDPKIKSQPVQSMPDYSSVLDDYAKCLQINPKFAFAYYNEAYVKCKMKDYKGAMDDLNKAIALEKDFAEAYFNRGLTKIYLDDVEGGAMDLSKAGELGIQDAYNVIKRYCN